MASKRHRRASEAKSDLANGFVLAKPPFLPLLAFVTWEYWPCLNSLAGDPQEEEEESCKMYRADGVDVTPEMESN